jgi:putative heme-binding domain-containing protein
MGYQGGASFVGFIRSVKAEALAALTPEERLELDPIIRVEYLAPARPADSRSVVQEWKLRDLLPEAEGPLRERDFERGKAAFATTQCLACHRFGLEGGATGPDLTGVAGRFSRRDLLDALFEPSKIVSDQYQNTMFLLATDDTVAGRVVREDERTLYVRTSPLDASLVEVGKDKVKDRRPSLLSPMPEGLLNVLRKDEILDLIAYLESGGNREHPAFRR